MSPPLIALAGVILMANPAPQAPPTEPAKVFSVVAPVPDNMSLAGDTLTGSYFVSSPLKRKYEALLDKLDALKRDIDADRVTGLEAVKSLAELRAGLKELRGQLDKSKVLIAAVQAHTRTETVSFDIGPDRTVVINASRVRLVGTDGDKIVCTLEKVYLGGDAREADAQLAGVKVAHKREVIHYTPGKSQAEDDAEAAAFRKSPAGQKYTTADFAAWAQTSAQIRAEGERYRGFWGRATDVISIEGLYSPSDSTVAITTASKGGEGTARQLERRHATLTVAVPKCQRVAVEGAYISLEVAGLHGSLHVTGNGDSGTAYEGQFTIKGVRGDVDVVGYLFSAVEDVTGSVALVWLRDSGTGNSGVRSAGPRPYEVGVQMSGRIRPAACAIKNVGGDLTGRFGQVGLHVEGVRGAMTVSNEVGHTKIDVKTPLAAAAAHRLTTTSGTIDVSFASGALGQLSVVGATSYGTFRTKSLAIPPTGFMSTGGTVVSDNFTGFSINLPKISIDAPVMLGGAYEPLRPGDKTPGLAIRTLAGHIVVTVADK